MKTRKHLVKNRILFIEIIIFALVLIVIWLDEFIDLPHLLFHASPSPFRIEEYLFETTSILTLGALVIFFTIRLVRRINQLESFARFCAWCHRIKVNDKWISVEDYLSSEHDMTPTHGICPDCSAKLLKQPEADSNESSQS